MLLGNVLGRLARASSPLCRSTLRQSWFIGNSLFLYHAPPTTIVMAHATSWSRPSANSTIPAPLYLSHEDVPYCHTCGRVMSSKKSSTIRSHDNNKNHTSKKKSQRHAKSKSLSSDEHDDQSTKIVPQVKYCSDKCRSRKPGPRDRAIERRIAALLDAAPDSGIEGTAAKTRVVKGDHRVVVTCDEIEALVFGSRFDPEKTYGRRKNRRKRWIGEEGQEWKSVDMESGGSENEPMRAVGYADMSDSELVSESEPEDVGRIGGGGRRRPPQTESDVNFSVGGERGKGEKIEETPEDREKRLAGARQAEEREIVRRAARRGIVFGFEVAKKGDGDVDESDKKDKPRRKAEALMGGVVVEPSFAKGNWSIRWRE